MNRRLLINSFIKARQFKNYLEIGCYKGKTFFKIDIPVKIGIDPQFHYSFYIEYFKRKINLTNSQKIKIFKKTSDAFFEQNKTFLKKYTPVDIALVDGLHTFSASLNDACNVLKYLNKDGVVVLHDCYPPSEAAAWPSLHFPTREEQKSIPGWTGAWCGDAWKTMAYLKKHHNESLSITVIDTDNGLGVLSWKDNPIDINIDNMKLTEINRLSYSDLVADAKDMVNLVSVKEFSALYNL